jgi:ubiquinone/menaquinone biosynthesis C-methylase UbiE
MNALLQNLWLAVQQNVGKQRLQRSPEQDAVTTRAAQVAEYNQALSSKLTIPYAIVLEIVQRNVTLADSAVDLACGPGHFTLGLARHLGCRSVLGLDLSPAMIAVARTNAGHCGAHANVRFQLGDITRLDGLPARAVAVATFTMGAHHLATLESVGSILTEMHRITRPEGLIVLADLARLRTADITNRFVGTLARDYSARGLMHLLDEYQHSMHAAWTVEELCQTIPRASGRRWWQLVPAGLPAVQLIVGLPVGQRAVCFRPWQSWPPARALVPAAFHLEWDLWRWLLFLGKWRLLP